ncbi:inositol monophosphatase [Coraliomargarita sp. SDUM461004]|uniref:Inositol monophosphatase n=1 Tax=Thalassobacterium sedimentorum TaxID=3041258 RepID=A0ABU1AH40_9BACT|nr:inositol monophosphatase [Coraliomargarita sp. SDUM461004]MDQ8194135.1 inositol monophosphatase [Coraliomargarita sp. SDUM461004]
MNRQAKAHLDSQLRHRINAGRVAVRNQIAFFERQFGDVRSEWKEDDTRVTFADFAISEKLFAELRRDFPRDDYCSEEASPLDETLALEARFAWVVDPIDGTNNYALGCSFCAISLALLLDGIPVYGFIYDHSSRDLLEGGPDRGLLRNQKKVDRNATVADAQAMVGLHFPMPSEQLQKLAPLLAKFRVRCIGSGALTAAYVATGYLTGVIDCRVKVWDIAAAYALCRAVDLQWTFVGDSPFPLRSFHPQMGFSPYYAGAESFMAELQNSHCF